MWAAYWQNRVARRLFALFLLVGALPVLLLGLYSYHQVRSQLMETGLDRLRQESKDYGMSIVGRLTQRADLLRIVGADRVGTGALDPVVGKSFTRLEWRTAAELPLTSAQRAHLERGEVVLQLATGNSPAMFLQRPGEERLIHAELAPGLWHDDGMVQPHCVLDTHGLPLFCSPGAEGLGRRFSATGAGHAGVAALEAGEQAYLVGFWRALLQSAFASPGFHVATFQPREEALLSLARFRQVFPAVLVLVLGAAAWLAMIQIRRQMRPLDSLAGAAQRLAEGDFDATLVLEEEDEFGDVARTFNVMRGRLRHKFHLLGMLADLDRAILSGTQLDTLLEIILREGIGALGCDLLAVVLAEGSGPRACCRLSSRGADEAGPRHGPEQALDPATRVMLESSASVLVLDNATAGVVPGLLADYGDLRLWAFPAAGEDGSAAALVAGFRQEPQDTSDLEVAGRSIADRLAVARSGFAWEEKLYRNTHYDPLTGLPNRTLLRDRVEQAVERARHGELAVAVLLLDLDRFKEVNDGLGHAAGDRLLVEVARRLAAQLREGETLARLGGDEFVILLTDLPREIRTSAVSLRVEELQHALAQPVSLDGAEASAAASVGIALYPDTAANFDGLLKGADSAMYAAKQSSPGSYRFCSEEINQRARQRFSRVQRLRTAMDRDEFLLHYQPKVAVDSDRITGVEALLRWRTEGEILPPGEFIALLDEIGLSDRVGDWVLHHACAQLAAWDRLGLPPLNLSVNVSPSQFLAGDFAASVLAALASSGLAPARLELEILEQTAIDASPETRQKLAHLRQHGIQIALDDFGTGYSSLVYLTQIPASILKLDRAFISPLPGDARQAAIVGGIISLGKRLGMQIVAEGVEDDAQRRLLARLGCDLIQGYVFSRPLPPEQIVRLLRGVMPVSA